MLVKVLNIAVWLLSTLPATALLTVVVVAALVPPIVILSAFIVNWLLEGLNAIWLEEESPALKLPSVPKWNVLVPALYPAIPEYVDPVPNTLRPIATPVGTPLDTVPANILGDITEVPLTSVLVPFHSFTQSSWGLIPSKSVILGSVPSTTSILGA